jgi:hypothetical protein
VAEPERAGSLAQPVQATRINVGQSCEIPHLLSRRRLATGE